MHPLESSNIGDVRLKYFSTPVNYLYYELYVSDRSTEDEDEADDFLMRKIR